MKKLLVVLILGLSMFAMSCSTVHYCPAYSYNVQPVTKTYQCTYTYAYAYTNFKMY